MTGIEEILLFALTETGKEYEFGAEVAPSATGAAEWDCSELVEWACSKSGVTMPDGAFNQWRRTVDKGTSCSVQDAMATRGALLFVGSGQGSGRKAITHVAFSLGDGTTIEARGEKWGVGSWSSANRFDFGGRIPGADYSGASKPITKPPLPQIPDFPGTCRKGDRGPVVRAFQDRLHARGAAIVADGVFGPRTETAVKAFQRTVGLTADGIAGRKTWTALWRS